MRLIAVARVRNEADIVEAFVRHHAGLVDWLILLDNGSIDATADILRSLKREGAPISLYRADTAIFTEAAHNTFLLRQAVALAADWVLCLDCDEFVDTRRAALPLRSYLAAVPADVDCLELALVNYHATAADNPDELIAPKRIRRRSEPSDVPKVFVRGRLAVRGATVAHGNHSISLAGQTIQAVRAPDLLLAHYPVRSGWQMLAKALVGRLKVLASGQQEERNNTAEHYTGLLTNLRDHPEWLLDDTEFLHAQRPPELIAGGVVDDPINYAGDALRYTVPHDPRLHAARSVVAYCETLARRHGLLLDSVPGARGLGNQLDGEPEQVF